MRILILGGDGYLGWPTAMYFSQRGHEVAVVDNLAKRVWEAEMGVEPLVPIRQLPTRIKRWREVSGREIALYVGDIAENHRFVYQLFDDFRPDAVVHYAEQPSAPFSMADREKCVMTQRNNVLGTLNVMFAMRHACPDTHIVKLGTMGEYGTPNIDIEEGWLELEHNGRKDRVMYPKKPGSFYHLSKVHDSNNLEFACRIWDMRVTDLNQGVVYGIDTDETALHRDLCTSFHYDAVFGTVLNRFIVQAVLGQPMTVYGRGNQTRGYLNIRDTLACVELATLNPAEPGEFRVFNQFTEQFSVNELAARVQSVAAAMGLAAEIDHVENPRIELEDHYYNARHSALVELGLVPHLLTDAVLAEMIDSVVRAKDRIDPELIMPRIHWRMRSPARQGGD
ncbi:MAG: NAD-dependent epimerase/dehydratase family protein [Hyphomicrobiales bacterium]|nr:NAD-dependent epimerase/dehydratase family protein [Hyphomicrobiales bacterium]MCP5370544.1 NAD-dependent epimerase/dehydratase family protein [Hyphomicrobiales bacterium]